MHTCTCTHVHMHMHTGTCTHVHIHTREHAHTCTCTHVHRWYNVREETFVTETDAAANDFKDPISGVDLKKMEEPSYFFKLSAYQGQSVSE